MSRITEDLKAVHRRMLIREVTDGKIKKDVLPNSAYVFSGALLADYSARTRVFMDSTLAHMIMKNHVDNVSEVLRGMEQRAAL